jgi:hypothetical protein
MATALPINPDSVQQAVKAIATDSLREDANFWAGFFGPAPGTVKFNPYERMNVTHRSLPDAFLGESIFLRDTTDGLIFDELRWTVTNCLPWAFTDQLRIEWNDWMFDRVIAGQVPHEGISRLVTSKRSQGSAAIVRRGLAMIMENDYLSMTKIGPIMFVRNLRGMAACVMETVDYDTLVACLNCKNQEQEWNESHLRTGVSYKAIIQKEIERFACVQMNSERLEFIVESERMVMLDRGVEPDLLILWSGGTQYIRMLTPERTVYSVVGPDGMFEYKKGVEAPMTMRRVPIFEGRTYMVDDRSIPVNPMERARYVSERYLMIFDQWRGSENIVGYGTHWRDIWLYDENQDRFVKVKFRDAFLHSKLFNAGGGYSDALQAHVDKLAKNSAPTPGARHPGSGKGMAGTRLHFLVGLNQDGVACLIDYFGQMEMNNADHLDFVQVAKTLLATMHGNEGEMMRIWNDGVRLIHSIESQVYDDDFADAVINANKVGSNTPIDIIHFWGMSKQLIEWKPNAHGSLNLPNRVGNVKYPFGFANLPGLRTIAEHANIATSDWHEIGLRAAAVVSLYEGFVNSLLSICPSCEFVNEKKRSPWFHLPDPVTVFFENVVSVPRDPIWIAAPGTSVSAEKTTTSWKGKAASQEVSSLLHDGLKYLVPSSLVAYLLNALGDRDITKSSPALVDIVMSNVVTGRTRALFKTVADYLLAKHPDGAKEIEKLVGILYEIAGEYRSLGVRRFIAALEKDVVAGVSAEKLLEGYYIPTAKSGSRSFRATVNKNRQEKMQSPGSEDPEPDAATADVPATKPDTSPVAPPGLKSFLDAVESHDLSGVKSGIVDLASHLGKGTLGGFDATASKDTRYYRSPLTMSKTLLESIAATLGERDDTPFMLPSDPRKLHLEPFFAGIEESIPAAIWDRPAYTSLVELIREPQKKTPDSSTHCAIAARMAATGGVPAPTSIPVKSKGSTAAARGGRFRSHDPLSVVFMPDDPREASEVASRRPFALEKGGRPDLYRNVQTHAFIERWNNAVAHPNPLIRAMLLSFLVTKCNDASHWLQMMDADVHVPVNIILWRLTIEHMMQSAVLMKGGPMTGGNVFGFSNWATAADVVAKTVYGNYTFRHKSVIWQPKNVSILADIYSSRYIGGHNTEFIVDTIGWEGSDDPNQTDRPSIIPTACAISENRFPYLMSPSGQLEFINQDEFIDVKNGGLHYSTAKFYDDIYKFSQRTDSEQILRKARFDDLPRVNIWRALQGLQACFNPASRVYNNWIECRGHLKEGCYVGAAAVWNGADKFHKTRQQAPLPQALA